MSIRVLLVAVAAVVPLALPCCHGGPVPEPPGPLPDAGEQPDATPPDATKVLCPTGQAPTSPDTCSFIGVQGCAPMFLDDVGVCRPSMAHCASRPGTIPQMMQGCLPVGIPDCAPVFVGDDGLCHVKTSACPSGTFAVPQKGCVPLDGPGGCGADPWGDLADGPDTVWVDPAAAPNGTGAQAAPVATITEALQIVPAGGRVLLAAGTYSQAQLSVARAVTIEGRCPSMVRIQSTSASPGIDVTADATLRGISTGGAGQGVRISGAVKVTLDRVQVRSATTTGILTTGAGTLTVSNSLIEDTLPQASDQRFGRGIEIGAGGALVIADSAIVRSRLQGIALLGPMAHAEIADVLVEGTLPEVASTSLGQGVLLIDGAEATIRNTAVVDNHEAGISAFELGSSLSLTESVVEGGQPSVPGGTYGVGVSAEQDAYMELRGNAVVDNSYMAVMVHDHAQLISNGNLYAKTRVEGAHRAGGGVMVQEGSRAGLADDVLWQNHTAGLTLHADGATATAQWILVEGTKPQPATNEGGVGVLSFQGGPLFLRSSVIVDNHVSAVNIGSPVPLSSPHEINFCLLAGTKAGGSQGPDGTFHADFGDGFVAALGANVTISQTIVEHNTRAGMLFALTTGEIRASSSRDNQYGVVLQQSPTVQLSLPENVISGNSAQDVFPGGDLSLPTAAQLVP